MTRTFIDASVLIAAARGKAAQAQEAMEILDDPDREFVSSDFTRLEVLPMPVYHGRADEEGGEAARAGLLGGGVVGHRLGDKKESDHGEAGTAAGYAGAPRAASLKMGLRGSQGNGHSCRAWNGGYVASPRFSAKNSRITAAVRAMSSALCAAETKAASNCEAGR